VRWIVQYFTSPPTQYRLYGRRFLQVKRPNQQYQSTEGRSTKDKANNENNKIHICRDNNKDTKGYTQNKHSKSPSLHYNGVTRGQLWPNRRCDQCVAADVNCTDTVEGSRRTSGRYQRRQRRSYQRTIDRSP